MLDQQPSQIAAIESGDLGCQGLVALRVGQQLPQVVQRELVEDALLLGGVVHAQIDGFS